MNDAIIFLGKYLYLLVILIALFFLVKEKTNRKKIIIFSIVTLFLSFIFGKIAGHFFYDTRPFVSGHFKPLIDHVASNGFPSDHALISFTISAIVYFFNRKLGIILALLGVVVGSSRVYAGIHNPVDILGSFVIGFGTALLVKYILKKQRVFVL